MSRVLFADEVVGAAVLAEADVAATVLILGFSF
jgi:hypothetical protein